MRIIVIFNLKAGVRREDYEAWARSTDMPIVRGLESVSAFEVLEATHLLGSDAPPPYQYVEIIDVADPERFESDVATEAMQQIAAAFQTYADNPQFLVTRKIDTLA